MLGDYSIASALSSLQTRIYSSFYPLSTHDLFSLIWSGKMILLFPFVLFLRQGSTCLLHSACQLLEAAMKHSVASITFYPWFHKEEWSLISLQTESSTPKCVFWNLEELISTFKTPGQGMVTHLLNPIMRRSFCPRRRLKLELNVYGKSPNPGSAGPLIPHPCMAYSAESMKIDDLFYDIIPKTYILCQETSSRHWTWTRQRGVCAKTARK